MNGRPYAPRGPGELQVALEGLREELRKVDNDLQAAHEVAEQAEDRWTEHYDEILDQLEEEANGSRLPGEEQRLSIARRRGGGAAWTNHRHAERNVRRLEKRATMVRDRIGSAQSEAKLQGIA